MYYNLILLLSLAASANAQFFNFFGNQQQHRQQAPSSHEDNFLNNQCQSYLCPDTQACVKSAAQCPCPFPKSQLKCALPGTEQFVCISKPATTDDKLGKLYDDPVKGPKAEVDGMRDCGWVAKAYKGLI